MTGVPIPRPRFAQLTRDAHAARRQRSPPRAPRPTSTTRFARTRCCPAVPSAKWNGTLLVPADGDYEINLQVLGATGRFWIDGRSVGNMAWWGGHGDIVFPNRENVIPTTDGLANVRRLVTLTAGPHALRVESERRQQRRTGAGAARLGHAHDEAERVCRSDRSGEVGEDRRGVCVEPQSSLVRPAGRTGPADRGRGCGESEHRRRAQHRRSRRHALARQGPRGARDVVHRRRRRLGRGEPAHRQGQSRRTLADHLAAGGSRTASPPIPRIRNAPRATPKARRTTAKACTSAIAGSISEQIEPLFPFGYGLSYTTFAYSQLAVRKRGGRRTRCQLPRAQYRQARRR